MKVEVIDVEKYCLTKSIVKAFLAYPVKFLGFRSYRKFCDRIERKLYEHKFVLEINILRERREMIQNLIESKLLAISST